MIISASRRTDIPAFYSEWFMNRVRAGYLFTRNPFNAHQIKRVSLNSADVEAIIFWTRDPLKMLDNLDELKQHNLKFCFLYTITGYPNILEKNVPNPHKAIDTFLKLSELIGPEKVIWRYDPVLLSSLVDLQEHLRLFTKISDALKGHTQKVIISFADIYKKVETNLSRFSKRTNISFTDLCSNETELRNLAMQFSEVSVRNGMKIQTCAEKIDLSVEGIKHGKCIDDVWIRDIFGIEISSSKDKGQREECGCIKSIDIGTYNTCLHGCEYCYATFSDNSVAKNVKNHDVTSPFLIGNADESIYQRAEPPDNSQLKLFKL
jgi:DNA repair photolyase